MGIGSFLLVTQCFMREDIHLSLTCVMDASMLVAELLIIFQQIECSEGNC